MRYSHQIWQQLWHGAALVTALLPVACRDEPQQSALPERRNAVTASPSSDAGAAPSARGAVAPVRKGPLCEDQTARDKPKGITDARAAGGAHAPGELEFGSGHWTWINVWAAWCGPCKEEMPRLLAWRDQLKAEGVKVDLHFVSIDDDERELMRFLEGQPERGVRVSYWLGAEDTRAQWFASIGYDDEPQLPVHAFVSPRGKLSCTFSGALEADEYPELAKVFAR